MFNENQRREFSAVDINRLKSKIWIHDLKINTGLKTTYEIWNKFDHKSSFSTWNNYENGISSPTFRKGIDRVAMMEELFPGSDRVFNCLSWEVLKLKNFSEVELKGAIGKLDAPISELILNGSVFDPAKIGGHPIDFSEFCDELKVFPDFTTLRGIILLLGLAKNFQSDEMWNGICSVYSSMIEEFLFHQTLPFYPEIFEIVDNFALRRERLVVNQKPTPIYTSWESHLPAYKEKLIQYYSTSLKLSDSLYGRFPDAGAEDDVKALATLLVEIVWQCGWSTTHNVSELWWPLLDRFKMLIQEIDEYNKLTDTEFFDFFARGFDSLFQKNEEEPLTISSHTPPFPSILEPLKISEDARRAGYSDNIEIFAPYINPGPSKN